MNTCTNPDCQHTSTFYFSGDIFVLVYSITSRDSFEEVTRLRNQILDCKSQCKLGSRKQQSIPIVLVGNKLDREKERVIDKSEAESLIYGQPSSDFLETSAKKDINIDQIFVRLFQLAKLPTEMSPSLHRRVTPSYVGASGITGKGVSIRRKMSDACGAIAPNVRRPSIRTDLLVAQTRTNAKVQGSNNRETKCTIQ